MQGSSRISRKKTELRTTAGLLCMTMSTFAPEGAEAQAKSKLILLNWCPDTAAIKKKMLYSSSFDTLKRAFVGVHKVKQANDESDIQQTDIEAFLRETDRN